jgi:C6 transcription factor Pro1
MKGPLRSKQGCWTCRLRRKKCDEKHPLCSTCESLKIICYGYGEKPDWMDNGEKEKAIANNIKQIVKKTSRQKGRLGISMSRFQGRSEPQKEDGPVKIAPKSSNVGTGHPTSVGADANAQSSGESGSPATLVGTCSAGASPVSEPSGS